MPYFMQSSICCTFLVEGFVKGGGVAVSPRKSGSCPSIVRQIQTVGQLAPDIWLRLAGRSVRQILTLLAASSASRVQMRRQAH